MQMTARLLRACCVPPSGWRCMARVLVVDDSDDFRETLALLVVEAGHDVTQAPHGGIALRLLSEQPVDVVLLDMMMPEVDGLDFLRRLPLECKPPFPEII